MDLGASARTRTRTPPERYQGPSILPRPIESSETHGGSVPGHLSRVYHRSCTECGRRKVRCNHHHPCSNCIRAGSECVFPTTRRPPVRREKSSKRRDKELLKSLQRLQRQLQSAEVPQTAAQADSEARDTAKAGNDSGGRTPRNGDTRSRHQDFAAVPSRSLSVSVEEEAANSPMGEPAQLMLDHDRSRYISNQFWASMSREIDEMRDILDESLSEQEQDDQASKDQRSVATPSSSIIHNSNNSFIFNSSASSQSLQRLYPTSSDFLVIFDIFQENVDPVMHIFHRPTMQKTVVEALPHLDSSSLDRTTEVVFFSISYAAITSLTDEECHEKLREDRNALLSRYRYATEQALSKARFLESQNLAVLAALILFLLCVRRHDDSRFVSGLLGVAIRNAQSGGLHRDGTRFHLSPYETEWRRRLWWHICVLDIRAAEDHGCDPSIHDYDYDTNFPLNINDDDISPTDTIAPPERHGVTDMTFCLLRFEVAVAIRKLNYHGPVGSKEPPLSTDEKRRFVKTVELRFQERYIQHCGITKAYEWVSATWARLMLSKMWLAVCSPLQSQDPGDGLVANHLRRVAFKRSVEMLELADTLETGHRAARWRWLFMTHLQWHAVAFILAYLCVYPDDTLSMRAWLVIDRVRERWPNENRPKKGMLWKPIERLVHRAQSVRASHDLSMPNEVGLFNQSYNHRGGDSTGEASSQCPEPLVESDVAVLSTAYEPDVSSKDVAFEVQASLSSTVVSASTNNIHHAAGSDENSSSTNLAVKQNHAAAAQFNRLSEPEANWTDIWSELQLELQDGNYAGTINVGDEFQEYGNTLWDVL